jgi:hypothetical protein
MLHDRDDALIGVQHTLELRRTGHDCTVAIDVEADRTRPLASHGLERSRQHPVGNRPAVLAEVALGDRHNSDPGARFRMRSAQANTGVVGDQLECLEPSERACAENGSGHAEGNHPSNQK